LAETKWYWVTVTILAVLIGGTWYFLTTSDKYDVCRKGNTYGDWYNITETIFVDNKFSAVGKYRCEIEDLELWCARVSGTRCYYVLEETSIPTDFTEVAEHGRTWDRTCSGGSCTISLKSGVVNVFEDGRWKKIQEAKSLKDKGFKVAYLENDPGLQIQIIDFNYTWIRFRFVVEDAKHLKQMLPVKVNKVKVKNFLWNNVGDVREYEIVVDNILDYNFSLGKNSTTIKLQDADTENLDDSEGDWGDGNSERGAEDTLYLNQDYMFALKFNTSSIASGSSIDDAALYIYAYAETLDTGEAILLGAYHIYTFPTYNISGSEWTEGDCSGAPFTCRDDCSGNEWCVDNFPDSISYNQTAEDTYLYSDGDGVLWMDWDTTNMVAKSFGDGDNNISILVNGTISSGAPIAAVDVVQIYAKEHATTATRPYLNITYSVSGDTCTCSNIQGGTPIDCSENCDIEACDVAGVDIQFTGAGTITVAGDITNIGDTTFSVGCAVELCPTCQWG